ncbi:hypothetical protein MTBBW1_2740002 [Desulfamplus magnetovallimortis]|uniref:Uncharacterized protein n=1 Tax=Desulfamplus magnetovallimortis TaxID=1246637 RepID=A0A1W1HF56_9BACT|nr:hypothetical protein [Desulfamplus magnetovallimortis]SLM31141.1 hypothetical protein MTBBW1_2740002 [Desulfamplus magnetovallimortis]
MNENGTVKDPFIDIIACSSSEDESNEDDESDSELVHDMISRGDYYA